MAAYLTELNLTEQEAELIGLPYKPDIARSLPYVPCPKTQESGEPELSHVVLTKEPFSSLPPNMLEAGKSNWFMWKYYLNSAGAFREYAPTQEMREFVDDLTYNGLNFKWIHLNPFTNVLELTFDGVVPQELLDRWLFIFEENTHPLFNMIHYIVITNNITNDNITV